MTPRPKSVSITGTSPTRRYASYVGFVRGGFGQAWVASLRSVATFGALATVSTVVPLLTSVAVPLWPLAFAVGVFVLRRRFPRTEQRRACLSLAAVAALVMVTEMLVAPNYFQQTHVVLCAVGKTVFAALLGGLAYASARIDDLVGRLVPARVH